MRLRRGDVTGLRDTYRTPCGLDGILSSVQKEAFDKSPRNTINNVFLSLQCAFRDPLSVDGDNTYKLSHLGKDKLRREGRLPISIMCDPSLIARGLAVLDRARNPTPHIVATNNNGSDTTESAGDTTENAVSVPVFATMSTENAVLATMSTENARNLAVVPRNFWLVPCIVPSSEFRSE